MSLSLRDRVKVNAGLLLLRDAGADCDAVIRLAEAGINIGTPHRQAYERAFGSFVASHPAFHGPLMRLGQLVEATDDRTVAGYGLALDRYVANGDGAMLQGILPTLQGDMADMAARTGDAAFADGLSNAPVAPAQVAPGQSPITPQPASEALPSGRVTPGWGPTGYTPSQDSARQPEAGG